jgi:hypothetical protein
LMRCSVPDAHQTIAHVCMPYREKQGDRDALLQMPAVRPPIIVSGGGLGHYVCALFHYPPNAFRTAASHFAKACNLPLAVLRAAAYRADRTPRSSVFTGGYGTAAAFLSHSLGTLTASGPVPEKVTQPAVVIDSRHAARAGLSHLGLIILNLLLKVVILFR